MTLNLKIPVTFLLIGIFACSNNSNSSKLTSPKKQVNNNQQIPIQLDTIGSIKYLEFKNVPKYIRHYLDSLEGNKYLIADPGKSFSGGCIVINDLPQKQMIWAALNYTSFQLEYWQGGFGLFRCLLTIQLEKSKIINHSVKYVEDGKIVSK